MREILFRGKNADGEWIEGNLVHQTKFYGDPVNRYHVIHVGEFDCDWYWSEFVIPETIGQYTGLTDKNGKKIFEGDIVKYADGSETGKLFEVEWGAGAWLIRRPGTKGVLGAAAFHLMMEVIGNIHDNPELLEGERKDNG